MKHAPSGMTANRDDARRALRAERRAIAAAERMAAADALAQRLLALPCAPTSGHVAGYWALDGEIALHVWQLALPRGVRYCLPVLARDARLKFAPWRPGEPLVTNRYGIPEPDVGEDACLDAAEMQLVAVPLVGFDRERNRLGMGGGWYDRTFAFRRERTAPPYLVGVGFACQQLDRIAPQAWDVPLDSVCTEKETLSNAENLE